MSLNGKVLNALALASALSYFVQAFFTVQFNIYATAGSWKVYCYLGGQEIPRFFYGTREFIAAW